MIKATPTASEVTSKYSDVNPYDRLYRDEHGYVIKVRVAARPAVSVSMTFDVTASWADDKTGKARLFDDGAPFIVAPMELTVMAESDTDLPALLDATRMKMVTAAGRAVANYYARQQLGNAVKTR